MRVCVCTLLCVCVCVCVSIPVMLHTVPVMLHTEQPHTISSSRSLSCSLVSPFLVASDCRRLLPLLVVILDFRTVNALSDAALLEWINFIIYL